MNKKTTIILASAVLVFIAAGGFLFIRSQQSTATKLTANPFNQAPHSSTGFGTDSARVDSQVTLRIPEGQAQAVYDYLRKTYVDSNELLKKSFPQLNLTGENRVDISDFTDDYFDTRNLDLYTNNNSARYRYRINTTDAADRKSGRELVQIKVTPPDDFMTRTEVKFDVQSPEKGTVNSDRHGSLVNSVVSTQRADFEKAFTAIGLDAHKLRYILTNQQKRSRVYLDWDTTNFLSFSVDEGSTSLLWAKAHITSIDVGLVENVYTAADEAKRQTLGDIRNFVLQDLKDHFPELTQTSQEKYGILLDQLISQISMIKTLIKWGLI